MARCSQYYSEVAHRLSQYFSSLDTHDWKFTLDCFEPTFDADYTSMVGGEPMKGLPREVNMHAWEGMLEGFDATHHQIGNITVEDVGHIVHDGHGHTEVHKEDEATTDAQQEGDAYVKVCLKGTATHVYTEKGEGEGKKDESQFWVTGGNYEMRLRCSSGDGKWRIAFVKFSQAWVTGDAMGLMEKAKTRAVAMKKAKEDAAQKK